MKRILRPKLHSTKQAEQGHSGTSLELDERTSATQREDAQRSDADPLSTAEQSYPGNQRVTAILLSLILTVLLAALVTTP